MRLLAFILALIITGCASQNAKPTVHGIDNFGLVAPGIYRGGQPKSQEAWDYLAAIGVTRIVKLNTAAEGLDNDPRFVVERFPIPFTQQMIFEPREKLVSAAVVALVPGTFIHCTHGQDRTGLIVGEYRVRMCGWTKSAAREEMREYGFHPILFGLERFWEGPADGGH